MLYLLKIIVINYIISILRPLHSTNIMLIIFRIIIPLQIILKEQCTFNYLENEENVLGN